MLTKYFNGKMYAVTLVFIICLTLLISQEKTRTVGNASPIISFESFITESFVCKDDAFKNIANENDMAAAIEECIITNMMKTAELERSDVLDEMGMLMMNGTKHSEAEKLSDKKSTFIKTVIKTKTMDSEEITTVLKKAWIMLSSEYRKMAHDKENYGIKVRTEIKEGQYYTTIYILTQ